MSKFIKWIRKVSSFPRGPPPETPTIIHVPRAMHEMEWDAHYPSTNGTRSGIVAEDVIFVVVQSAQGATDYRRLKELLQKETGEDIRRSTVHTCDEWEPTYYCGEYRYCLILLQAPHPVDFWEVIRDVRYFSVFLNYDASSTQSWNEMVASHDDISSRCEAGVIPLPTVVAAMGEGCVSREEAEDFAQQRSCRLFQYSPVTGHGLCNAFASIVERAHAIRLQYATDADGFQRTATANNEAARRMFG